MNKLMQLAALATSMISTLHAAPYVIYGQDDRHEVYEASASQQALAKSTAVLVSKYNMSRENLSAGQVQLTQSSLREWIEFTPTEPTIKRFSAEVVAAAQKKISFCEGTRFADQPNPGTCSGFLIAPDLIVTAGHCVEMENFCEDYQWVFDFKVDKASQSAGLDIKEENIYKCQKVVSHSLATALRLDYAVVKLDRKVQDRTPLKINSGSLDPNSKVMVIGSPSGLPTKVTTNGSVRKDSHPNFFVTNLDTFQGNSGSAVFNQNTGVVEGILVRGEEDYVLDFQNMCIKANECEENECRGEDVSRMTSIPEVSLMKYLFASAIHGNLETLKIMLDQPIWIDFYTADGQSALIKAASVAQDASMKLLLEKGADVKLSDAKGDTALHKLSSVLTNKNADSLNTLIAAGASLEAKNDLGQTALLAAGSVTNLEAAKLLIKAGADKNALDSKGDNILLPFLKAGREGALIELANMGVDLAPVMKVATKAQKMKMKLLKLVKKINNL